MSTDTWPDIEEQAPTRQRSVISALIRSPLVLLLPFIALALGILWNWPWLAAEHKRLEPWKVPIIWMSECVASFWYLWFCVRYTLAWTRSKEGQSPTPRKQGGLRIALVIITIVLGGAIDLTVSLFTMFEEYSAHAKAQQAVAEVVDGSRKELRNGQTLYTLSCRFRDGQNAIHEVTLFAGLNTLPAAVEQAVAAGQFPAALPILYDPDWPSRSWTDSQADPHYNRLYLMSFCVILFQTLLGVALIAINLQPDVRVPPVEVCSFLAVALVLLLSGVGKLLLGES